MMPMLLPSDDFIAIRVIGNRFVTRFPMPPLKPEDQTFKQWLRPKPGHRLGHTEDGTMTDVARYKLDHAD